MYQVTIFSERLYLDENRISEEMDLALENNIVEFNRILFSVYNFCLLEVTDIEKYNKILEGTTLFKYVRAKYGIDSYYANTIINVAHERITSQTALQKLYISQTQVKIDTKKKSISCKQEELKDLLTMEDRIVKYRKKLHKGKYSKLTSVKGLGFLKITDNVIYVRKKKEWVEISLSKLEYEYILPKIRKCKNLLGKYKHRLTNLEIKLNKLQTIKPMIFGTKAYMKEYNKGIYTKYEFLRNKYKSYQQFGRCNFPNGNRAFMPIYDEKTNSLTFTALLLNGKNVYITDVKFPYRQEELVTIIKYCKSKKGQPINVGIRKHKDLDGRYYYQVRTSFNIETTIGNIITDTSHGVIGLDFNLGHVDVSEVDSKGNLIFTETLYYKVSNKSSENAESLKRILDEVGIYSYFKQKPVIIEDLDFNKLRSKCNSDKTQQRGLNRCINSMPIDRYTKGADYLSVKYNIGVYKINPVFTSVIGELKYSNPMKLNTHVSASYVIARRGMKLVDHPTKSQFLQLSTVKPIKEYTSNWSMWSTLNKIKTT